MNKRQAFLDLFMNGQVPVMVYRATVKSVEADTCTVVLLANEMEVPDVQLTAEEGTENPLLVLPKVGSTVLVAAIENDIANAFVCSVSLIEKVSFTVDKTTVNVDKDEVFVQNNKSDLTLNGDMVQLRQGQTYVTMKDGKVEIKNSTLALKDLFDDLADLITNLKVLTSMGPSTGLFPDTIVSLTAFKTKYPQLLK